MSRILLFLSVLSVLALSSCIENDFIEDFVQPELRITSTIDSLNVDSTFTFDASFFNNIGQNEDVDLDWSSSDESVVTVSDEGVARGIGEGDATITVSYFDPIENITVENSSNIAITTVFIAPPPEPELRTKEGVIETTTFYVLEGDFTFNEEEDGVFIDIASNYRASSGLPGLFIYLSNNRNSIAGALEIAPVTTFSGAHSYTVPDVGFEDYRFIVYFCKPFNVKVGDAEL